MTDFSKVYSWWLDACRLRVWLLKRPQPQVPHLVRPKYDAELAELDRFAAWLHWFIGHRVGPRPPYRRRVPAWAWTIEAEYAAKIGKPKPPVPPPPPPAKPSWTLPGPLLLTASDPGSANGHAGVGSIGVIVRPGVGPVWKCSPVNGPGVGWLAQIEGDGQLAGALDYLSRMPASDSRAIIGTGNVPATELLKIGVNFAFYELNAQASWEPYGNAARILFQCHQDGYPHCRISYGVYDEVGIAQYGDYVPDVWSDETKGFVRGAKPQGLEKDCAVFSAEGTGDTNSWTTIASL